MLRVSEKNVFCAITQEPRSDFAIHSLWCKLSSEKVRCRVFDELQYLSLQQFKIGTQRTPSIITKLLKNKRKAFNCL